MASLSLRHIRKVYPARRKSGGKKAKVARDTDDFVAVKDFCMEIEDGEFIVFVGPSGCGKSTTLRMVAHPKVWTKLRRCILYGKERTNIQKILARIQI
mgnify:CR=1 FL=1